MTTWARCRCRAAGRSFRSRGIRPAGGWSDIRRSGSNGVVDSPTLNLEEYLEDLTGQVFGLVEALRGFIEGVVEVEDVVVGDLEGEVAGLAVECRIPGDAEGLGVVEDDCGILI